MPAKATWETLINKCLKGKTIKGCRYMSAEELENTGWHSNPIVIMFTDGSYIVPMSDDEGNDAGAMSASFKSLPVIPVMRD